MPSILRDLRYIYLSKTMLDNEHTSGYASKISVNDAG